MDLKRISNLISFSSSYYSYYLLINLENEEFTNNFIIYLFDLSKKLQIFPYS